MFWAWSVLVVIRQEGSLGCRECLGMVCVGCDGAGASGNAGVWGMFGFGLCWLCRLWNKRSGDMEDGGSRPQGSVRTT
jgi:hypothetical protein